MEWIKLISYVLYLEENLDDLKLKRDALISLFQDIRRKIKLEERWYRRPAREVVDWLKRVEAITEEVDGILEEGEQEVNRYCLGGLCPRNLWVSYVFGKRVEEKQTALDALISESAFIQRAAYGPASPLT
ncbi:hypothetical protein CRG98_015350 [Punica granatum]|nr:hypothetical protein CRG98_015350 [Punica granatum]